MLRGMPTRSDEADPASPVEVFAARHLGEEPVAIEEIGNGNLNHVYRVSGSCGSIVVKQALPYVRRAGANWPLTIRRLGTEARAYQVHTRACPGALPTALGYDGTMHMLALEDLRGATDWRTRLSCGLDTPDTSAAVGQYCARVATSTGSFLLTTAQATELRNAFGDPAMKVFTERMVFTAPYREDPTNVWPAHLAETARRIRSDETVRAAAARARWIFRTAGECLLHGDLHSGSVMAGEDFDARIIDLEFAFVGPIAFDLGNLIAHLLLARTRRTVTGGDVAAIDASARAFWSSFAETLCVLTTSAGYWSPRFERRLLRECALFAGVEILRRIGGHFHVDDIATLKEETRIAAERRSVNLWYRLVTSTGVREFDELWELAVNSTKDYL